METTKRKNRYSNNDTVLQSQRSKHGRQLLALLKGVGEIDPTDDYDSAEPTPRATWMITPRQSSFHSLANTVQTDPSQQDITPRARWELRPPARRSSHFPEETTKKRWDVPVRQRSNSISEHLDGSKKKSWRTKQLRTPKNPFERLEPPENLDMKNLKHQLSSASSQSSTHSPAVFAACRASDKRAKNVDMGATINLDSDLDLRPRNQSTHKRKAKLPPLNYNSSGGPEEDFPLSSSYSALRVQMPHIDSKDDFSSSDEEKTPTFGGNMGPSVVIGVTAEALKKARYRLTDEEEKLVRQVVSYKEGDVKSMECRRRLWTLTGYACGFVPEALEKDIEDRDYNPTVLHKQIQRGGETVLGMSLMNDTQYVKYESTSSSDDDLYMGPQINASLPRPASEMNAQKPRNKSRINTYHSADNAQLRQVAAASASSSAKTLPDFLFEDFKSGNTTRRHNKTRRSKFK